MDLTFAELDEYNFQESGVDESHNYYNNNNNNNNFKNEIISVNSNLTTYTNYWHKNNNPQQNENVTKNNSKNNIMKPLTYDDILNSLNLKAKDGNLEFIEKTQKPQPITVKKNVTFESPHSPPLMSSQLTSQVNINLKKDVPQEQFSGIDKNSYIYNKYFKDYKDESAVEEPKKPMTREEYIQEYNRRIYEKRRIEQIKSKKLMFSRGNDVNISISNPHHNLNKLFRM